MDVGVLETVLGVTGNIFSVVLFVPNALTVYRHRKDTAAMRGVSATMQLFVLGNALTWFLYAWVTQAWWVAAPGAFNAPLAVFVLVLIWRAHRVRKVEGDLAQTAGVCSCGWSAPGVVHELLCVIPPGYGTRFGCDGVSPRRHGYVAVPVGAVLPAPPAEVVTQGL